MTAPDGRPVGEDDLHASIDGRLDPDRHAIVEDWLSRNPEAAGHVRIDRALGHRLREQLAPVAAEPIPARLRIANLRVGVQIVPTRRWAMAAAILLSLGLGGAGGWLSRGVFGSPAGTSPVAAQAALAAYRTFVVEVAHPVEVRADQTPHLVQWLSRRLDHAVRIPDLTAEGFRLMGGRIVPAGERPAALLMYDDEAGLRLTLYARAHTEAGGDRFRAVQDDGVRALSWGDAGLAYVVTARASEARLTVLAQAIDRQVRRTASP